MHASTMVVMLKFFALMCIVAAVAADCSSHTTCRTCVGNKGSGTQPWCNWCPNIINNPCLGSLTQLGPDSSNPCPGDYWSAGCNRLLDSSCKGNSGRCPGTLFSLSLF